MNPDKRRADCLLECGFSYLSPETRLTVAHAIRASDEAAGMVLVPKEDIAFARAVLARTLSAGHNVPGPTHEEVNAAFWKLHDMLAAGGDEADV